MPFIKLVIDENDIFIETKTIVSIFIERDKMGRIDTLTLETKKDSFLFLDNDEANRAYSILLPFINS